jgi:hypothetical protein
LNWIELNWIELNWIELNWIELNWIELNWIELNWIELNWIELSETNEIKRTKETKPFDGVIDWGFEKRLKQHEWVIVSLFQESKVLDHSLLWFHDGICSFPVNNKPNECISLTDHSFFHLIRFDSIRFDSIWLIYSYWNSSFSVFFECMCCVCLCHSKWWSTEGFHASMSPQSQQPPAEVWCAYQSCPVWSLYLKHSAHIAHVLSTFTNQLYNIPKEYTSNVKSQSTQQIQFNSIQFNWQKLTIQKKKIDVCVLICECMRRKMIVYVIMSVVVLHTLDSDKQCLHLYTHVHRLYFHFFSSVPQERFQGHFCIGLDWIGLYCEINTSFNRVWNLKREWVRV